MLFGVITGLAAAGAAAICGGAGGFEDLAWLWMLPVFFAGLWILLTVAKYIGRAEVLIAQSKMLPYGKKFMRKGLREVREGLDAWDFPFSMMFLAEGFLAVSPRVKLVANAGVCDTAATHTGGYNYYAPRFAKAGSLEFPLLPPKEVVCDEGADRRREQMEGAIFPRGMTWLGCKFPQLCPLLSTIGRVVESALPIVFRFP